MFRLILQTASALLLGALPALAQPANFELECRPEHGLLDRRRERPSDVRQHSPFSTYYLFDNPQLFEYRVSLINLSPERRGVADVDTDWASALQVRVSHDGVRLGPGEFRVETTRRLSRRLTYLQDGVAIAPPVFRRQLAGPGSEPVMPFDDYRHDEQVVDVSPRELGPNDAAVAILRLTAADGSDLPLGLYVVSVTDEANGVRCPGEQLVVLRSPRSPLDTIDAHIVRANAYEAQGDLEAAANELARATELAPDVPKGWVYRSALALLRNDLAGQAEAATRLEALLAQPAAADHEEFEGVSRDAAAVARYAPELRRLLAAARAAAP